MSTHYHAVVYDRLGRVSDFLRDFHGVMGRFGRWRDEVENTKFWSAQESEAVEIGDMDTFVECAAYTLANPTTDFIVERPEQWIGVMTPVELLGSGRGQVFHRPKRFFDPDGMTSGGVMLCSDYPHELEALMPHETFRERVRARVEGHIAKAHAEGRLSYETTMGALDMATSGLDYALGLASHLEATVGTKDLREAYAAVQGEVSEHYSGIVLSEPLYAALSPYAETPEAPALTWGRKRLLE